MTDPAPFTESRATLNFLCRMSPALMTESTLPICISPAPSSRVTVPIAVPGAVGELPLHEVKNLSISPRSGTSRFRR